MMRKQQEKFFMQYILAESFSKWTPCIFSITVSASTCTLPSLDTINHISALLSKHYLGLWFLCVYVCTRCTCNGFYLSFFFGKVLDIRLSRIHFLGTGFFICRPGKSTEAWGKDQGDRQAMVDSSTDRVSGVRQKTREKHFKPTLDKPRKSNT